MNDVMTALRERLAKAESKVQRATKALEMAKKELSDLIAAERVMAEITGESADRSYVGSGSDRDREILKLLPLRAVEARSPAEIHGVYREVSSDQLNLDAFRTALWRLQRKQIEVDGTEWQVRSDSGRYWREATSNVENGYNEWVVDDEPNG